MSPFDRPVGPRSLAVRAEAGSAAAEVLRRVLAEDGARLVLLVPDPHARFAAVELAAPFAAEVLDSGYGVCSYVFAWTPEREPLPEVDALKPYLGGFGDLRVRLDAATAFRLGDQTWAVVGDAELPSGEPAGLAPRTVVRTQLARLEEHGLVPSIGIEHEVVFRSSAEEPLTGHGVDYALGGTERLAPLLADLRSATAGLGVESARAECHPGQYEVVLRHRDALAACDDALLLQMVTRRVAARHGGRADYLAAPEPGQGNSCHVHLSLSASDGPAGFPLALGAFLAGVLRDARALSAVWAPTWNSYVRLRTAPFSPRELRWGPDDRTASIRLCGTSRLEFRFAGADAQPHLVVAALIAAGTAGLAEQLSPPDAGALCGQLASSPWEALELLERGRAAELLGEDVAAQQAALLREELDAALGSVTDLHRRRGALRS
ncbi:glutamine synthetase [Amycolatopsis rubida]|uniref:Glutamine synthetase n=1 Tax=Amycolatopsis rubida TaxID=112413 RepID=A0ABX0C9I4_9PSEU|nr:glutamine synthetase [Amycolatopsis sp. M39]MYW96616.1 glutamine synthetase [Amycolatopsis rubida]NEC61600.1 glutamine synthetase [Amycolatopsis rubida]OAP26557.1 Gamma-glutamylputrescine synthetase PuuA [Amycolatopsis sp. M39]